MKEQELLAAIGGAEDRFLEELEQPKVRRLPRQFGLAAALIALLLTACAAPAVIRNYNAMKSAAIVEAEQDLNLEEIWKDKYGNEVLRAGPTVIYTSGTISLEVEASPDAPETIGEYYLPLKLLECCNVESYTLSDTVLTVELSMDTAKKRRVYSLIYQQQVLPEDGQAEVEGVLGIGPWENREVTYGNITAQEFNANWVVHAVDLETGEYIDGRETVNAYIRHVFWSDGRYLYGMRLVMMPPVNAQKVQDIMDSLTAVEDLSQYLTTAE